MPTTRRQFIKQSVGAVTASVLIPKLGLIQASGQSIAPAANLGRKLVVIQLAGGNDGLNTVIPYSDSRYLQLRPTIGFQESELVDDVGVSTKISSELAFHPRFKEIRDLFNSGKVAVVRGVGYPNFSTSHFTGTSNVSTGKTDGSANLSSDGWLGTYAAQAFAGQPGFLAASIGGTAPQAFLSPDYVIPNIASFSQYTFQTDSRNARDGNNQIAAFKAANSRTFDEGTYLAAVADTGLDAFNDSVTIQTETAKYNPQGYPNTGLGNALKMVAQLFVTIPTTSLAHCAMGGFDTHQGQIVQVNGQLSKTNGGQAALLMQFSQAVNAFYNDLAAHGISQNTLIMTYSEFGRRPQGNGTEGTDHGRAAPWFVIGDAVHGGFFSDQPSLAATSFDSTGNQVNTCDFRQIYAEILDKWFSHDSKAVLGATYSPLGILG